MQGPTLAMSPAFNEDGPFSRSHSSPNIPDLINFDFTRPAARSGTELPRSASFNCLPTLDGQYAGENLLEKSMSADVSAGLLGDMSAAGKASTKLSNEDKLKAERVGRRKSLVSRPKSWIQNLKGSPDRQNSSESLNTLAVDIPPVPPLPKGGREAKSKLVSGSFATFARKTWISSSRSPSPSTRTKLKEKDVEHNGLSASEAKPSLTTRPSWPVPPVKEEENDQLCEIESRPMPRGPTTLQKIRQRPQSVLLNFSNFASANSSTSSLPSSSLDNRSTPRTSTDKLPPLPKSIPPEKLNPGKDTPRKRDELWSAFRALENDFTKFQNKSWSLKTNIVRSSLLPFLRNHASHPSNKTLRAEDLDRRVAILNKWWIGLLDVLDGRQNQTVSGVDRPILLDACYAIMTRPEWRLPPSTFAPLSDRFLNIPSERSSSDRKQSSTTSLSSSASQFMVESVYHNTRNLFTQNLLSQMTLVVEKMSLRHAPASLVTFCGKAAAYAFFFVPGVAETLVRLWNLQANLLRRVSDEMGMPKRPNKLDFDEVVAGFPSYIQCLGWTSVKQMAAQLRQPPNVPVMGVKAAWDGPWVARWCGRDSDLFFVFAKHYHILAEEFVPSELSLTEKARAPGFMLVQAQILSNFDATIHRQPTTDPLPITFDDVLSGADASAALPLPSTNSARLMAENRLVMLLRDFISERPSDHDNARLTFAEAFGKMMQAGARRTSLFDHNACFVLCDFMEEALSIFLRFYHTHALESDFIDWYFWLEVCQKMLESQNSMSEIRLFAFLFGAWNVISLNERRKEVMCLNWLLTEETFDRFFNHWCPMVRAYYMRLICWRACRDDGEPSDLDTKIFSVVSTRIKATWAHYLFLKQSADHANILPPSTAPCHPAPGRRLLIIRNDTQSPTSNIFFGFDGFASQSQSNSSSRRQSLTSLNRTDSTEDVTDNSKRTIEATSTTAPNKKRWTFMGKLLASGSPAPAADGEGSSSPPRSRGSSPPTKTLEGARKETALARTRPPLHAKTGSTDSSEVSSKSSTHYIYCFKFSLEWNQHFEKPGAHASTYGGSRSSASLSSMGAERRLLLPRLPAAAQASLSARIPNTNREVVPSDPRVNGVERATRAKYSGRALAEWASVVQECNNFFDRRRAEGVPSLRWVEVPTLGVEGFRRFVGER